MTTPSMSELQNLFADSITKSDNTYTLIGSITIDNTNYDYFPIPIEDNVTFDGGYNADSGITITYEGTDDWPGLFAPVDDITFTAKNIMFLLNNGTIAAKAGSIIGSNKDGTAPLTSGNTITVNNCHGYYCIKNLSNHNSGGIVGSFFGSNAKE